MCGRRVAMQAGNEVRDRDVEKARRCQGEDGGKHFLHRCQSRITRETADQRRCAGRHVVGERAPADSPNA